MRHLAFAAALLAGACAAAEAQAAQPRVTEAMAPFVSEASPVIALIHARVIDGTGASPQTGQTLLLRDGQIEAVGPDGSIPIPARAKTIDLTGKTVLPGLVQLHEHLWMFSGGLLGVPSSVPKLLLAAGVTSVRTAGSYNPYADLKAWTDIQAGRAVGPWMDLSVYLNLFSGPLLTDPEAARRYLTFWLDQGFTSVKAYASVNKSVLKAAIDLAHERGVKVTGHLCETTFAEAAELGIDNIEHGFANAPDFVPPGLDANGQARDSDCGMRSIKSLEHIDPKGAEAKALIAKLVAHKVAMTSTLVVLEDLMPNIPPQRGIEMLAAPIREYHMDYRARISDPKSGILTMPGYALTKSAAIELEFMRAGGLLVSGTDPAGRSAGNLAGYASTRQLELMVEHGFTPMEALRVSTLNGAIYLRRQDQIGSIAPKKQADLLIVDGDPSTRISDVANAVMVFKQGIGYDPAKLRASVRGKVGLQ